MGGLVPCKVQTHGNAISLKLVGDVLKNRFNRRLALKTLVAAGLPSACASPAPPAVDKHDLFSAGQGGYSHYRIPGVVATPRGTLLAYCEARLNSRHDWSTLDVLVRRSPDSGDSWSEPYRISDVPGPKEENPAAVAAGYGEPYGPTYNNPTAIAARDGTVHLLYCLEYMRCFYVRSLDDGRTFSDPVEITPVFERFRKDYDWRTLSTGPGHGIELRNSRLVVGVRLADAKGRSPLRHTAVSTIYSDDGGDTWERGEIAIEHSPETVNPNEPIVVELAGGRVMMNVRNESPRKRRLVVHSPDGATRWSAPRFDDALWDSGVMASNIRVDERTIAFANPHSLDDRSNLSVRLSRDEGETWQAARTIEAGPSAYSDMTVLPDGRICCFYERGDEAGTELYGRLTLARFTPDWIGS